jgi:hypothetical protein
LQRSLGKPGVLDAQPSAPLVTDEHHSMSRQEIAIGEPTLTERFGRQTLCAKIWIGSQEHDLWFRVHNGTIANRIEPFVAACYVLAMKNRMRLCVPQPVSLKMLEGLEELEQIFCEWYPQLHPVQIEAIPRDPQKETPKAQGVATFFTGGVDSFYTLRQRYSELTGLIFVHGFDIPLKCTGRRQQVAIQLRTAADRVQLPLVEVETNLREIMDAHLSWPEHAHGAAQASVALLFPPQFHRVYIAASNSYPDFSAFGSHPFTDPLWSTEEVEIVHDGFYTRRLHKVEELAQWDVAMDHLRVCWKNRGDAYNCCRCEKCVRTMVALRIVGGLQRCKTFPRGLRMWDVRLLTPETEWLRICTQENLEELRKRGHSDPALEKALQDGLSGRYHRGVWKLARRLVRRLRGNR